MRDLGVLALLVALLLLVAAPALGTYFLADDFFLFGRAWSAGKADLGPVLEDLARPWQGLSGIPYWRPLASAAFALDNLLFPGRAGASHAFNLLLHAAAGLGAYAVSRRLFPTTGRWFSVLLAGVGLLGATRAEPLGWISGRVDLLPGALLLASFALSLKHLRKGGAFAASVALYSLALLSKESAIVGPLVLAGLDLAAPGEARPGARRSLYGSLALASAAYLALRRLLLGPVVPEEFAAVFSQPATLLRGLVRSVVSSGFPLDRGTLGDGAGFLQLGLAAAAVAAVAPGVLGGRASPRGLGGALLAWLASSLPGAPLPPGEHLGGARVLYLAGFGWAFSLGAACGGTAGAAVRRGADRLALGAVAGLLLLGALSLRWGLDRWRAAGETARSAVGYLAPRLGDEGPPAAILLYPGGVPGISVFLFGGPGRTEGIAPALLGPFTRRSRAPLALRSFVPDSDGAPHHALRALGARFLGFGDDGTMVDWSPPPEADPVPLSFEEAAPVEGGTKWRLRGGAFDPRRFAAILLEVSGGEGAEVGGRVEWGAAGASFRGRVRSGRIAIPVGNELLWWIAGEREEIDLTMRGLPAQAVVHGGKLVPDPLLIADSGEEVRVPDLPGAISLPAPREGGPLFRLVLVSPLFSHEADLTAADLRKGRLHLDLRTSRRLREGARTLHGLDVVWFVEAVEEVGNRMSAYERTRPRIARLPG